MENLKFRSTFLLFNPEKNMQVYLTCLLIFFLTSAACIYAGYIMATSPESAQVVIGDTTFRAKNFWLASAIIFSYLNLIPILIYIIQRSATRSGVGAPEDEAKIKFNNTLDGDDGYITIDATTPTQTWRLICYRPSDNPSADRSLQETSGAVAYTTFKLGPAPSNLPRPICVYVEGKKFWVKKAAVLA